MRHDCGHRCGIGPASVRRVGADHSFRMPAISRVRATASLQ
ncbi:hypothetical protein BURMUCF2_1712 [Burkholderia multivorans CF2]|nr:hypothetical protein BURMUCF2_1712 [Burkholderia multivorans CF2]